MKAADNNITRDNNERTNPDISNTNREREKQGIHLSVNEEQRVTIEMSSIDTVMLLEIISVFDEQVCWNIEGYQKQVSYMAEAYLESRNHEGAISKTFDALNYVNNCTSALLRNANLLERLSEALRSSSETTFSFTKPEKKLD
jgi:hypothetical protein